MSRSPALDINLRMQAVLAAVGYIPSIATAVMAERAIDIVSHQRLALLKSHRGNRRMQQFLASQIRRYGPKSANAGSLPRSLGRVKGAVWAEDKAQGGRFGDSFEILEFGRGAVARSGKGFGPANFVVPVPAWRQRAAFNRMRGGTPENRWAWWPKEAEFHGDVVTLERTGGRAIGAAQRRADPTLAGVSGRRTEIIGYVVRSRRQRPMLGYMRVWESKVLPAQERHLDRAARLLVSEAGRGTLAREQASRQGVRDAFAKARADFLAANPEDYKGAKAAASAAAKEARRTGDSRKGARS